MNKLRQWLSNQLLRLAMWLGPSGRSETCNYSGSMLMTPEDGLKYWCLTHMHWEPRPVTTGPQYSIAPLPWRDSVKATEGPEELRGFFNT